MQTLKNNPTLMLFLVILLVQAIFHGGYSSPVDWLVSNLLTLPGIIIALSFHEYAHAKAAVLCGDPTPKMQGRLTVNPAAHVDALGLISLLFIGFGWGKPVQINPYNFKNRRRDTIFVSLAGVLMNLVLAVVFMGIIRVLCLTPLFGSAFGRCVLTVLQNVVVIDLVLMVFNFLPIPPLDGFNFFTEVFDLYGTDVHRVLYQNGYMILMLLIVFNVTGSILSPAVNGCYHLLYNLFF